MDNNGLLDGPDSRLVNLMAYTAVYLPKNLVDLRAWLGTLSRQATESGHREISHMAQGLSIGLENIMLDKIMEHYVREENANVNHPSNEEKLQQIKRKLLKSFHKE